VPNQDFNVGSVCYSPRKPFIIAEIGTSHGGDRTRGAELVAAAAEAGADCVKFQHVLAAEIIHPATGLVPLPGGAIPLYERFVALQTSPEFLQEMIEEAAKRAITFMCTPFGLQSARDLRRLGVGIMKVASPELNHLPLLKEIASYRLPTILSTGVSRLADIETAVGFFQVAPCKHESHTPFAGHLGLLHCVTAYPAPEKEYNLSILPLLSGIFGCATGVSDHSMDPILVPSLAVTQGAAILEKHICLSRSGDGLDDPIALPPDAFAVMVKAVKTAVVQGPRTTIEYLAESYGSAYVEAVLGSGIKQLAPSEAANYERTNRSIHASRKIQQGEVFCTSNLALLRTEKVLRPGLHPSMWTHVLGRRAAREVPDGEGIEWPDIGGIIQA
jgi:sialic acid synthase SpsE